MKVLLITIIFISLFSSCGWDKKLEKRIEKDIIEISNNNMKVAEEDIYKFHEVYVWDEKLMFMDREVMNRNNYVSIWVEIETKGFTWSLDLDGLEIYDNYWNNLWVADSSYVVDENDGIQIKDTLDGNKYVYIFWVPDNLEEINLKNSWWNNDYINELPLKIDKESKRGRFDGWESLVDKWDTWWIEKLSEEQQIWFVTHSLIWDIQNGGLFSFFYNSWADNIDQTVEALKYFEAYELINRIEQISILFWEEGVPDNVGDRNNAINSWWERNDDLIEEIDNKIVQDEAKGLQSKLEQYLISNRDKFLK